MRVLTRLTVIGILIASCSEPIGPGPTTRVLECVPASPDTIFILHPDSLHVVVGSADAAYAEWGVSDKCSFAPFPAEEMTWTIRDTSIATETVPNADASVRPVRHIVPRTPGRTFLVVEARGSVDSMAVFVPDTVVLGPVTAVSAAGAHSCAVTEGGEALCWGSGNSVLGEPGVDPAIGTCFGSPCSPMPVPLMTGARAVYSGLSHACVLDAVGAASCWGDNHWIQLGRDWAGTFYDPGAVSGGLEFAALTLGGQHTCGLSSEGVAYCWGDHSGGKLGGDQRSGPVLTPAPVDKDLRWSSIDARNVRTCGATDAGHLYCWGLLWVDGAPLSGATTCELFRGKEGPVTAPCSNVPLRMELAPSTGADTLFAQTNGDCALTTLGSVYCYRQGTGRYAAKIGFGPFASLAAGDLHMCGLSPGGDALCWGANESGQLGNGTTMSSDTPVTVSGGHMWTQIAAGTDHTCGLTMGEVWCWGATWSGQTGTSVLGEAWIPVKAHGQD